MGDIREPGNPFIGVRTTFVKAYPMLESAKAEFLESDQDGVERKGYYSASDDAGRVRCGNPHCKDGGYDFESVIAGTYTSTQTDGAFELACSGTEGSSKSKRCLF